jgi:glycosyltransferase involved in cell wall biosynthesis
VLDSDVVVADVVDDVLARVGDARRARMYRAIYRTVFNAADHAFATSEQVVRRFPDAPCDIEVLPNGVTVPEGEGPREKRAGCEGATRRGTRTAPDGRESRPLAVYAGQLNQALDAEIVESVIEQCPEVTFRFYGPVSDPAGQRVAAALADRPNADLAGAVPHAELHRRLCQADVLLNFKKPDHTTSGNDLLKIYEYLATGRPIVSPCVSPVDRFEDVIRVAETPDQFADQVRAALRDESEERSKRRVAYARSNSWASRVDKVVHILLALRSASAVRESTQADVPVGGSVKERKRGQPS